jgi:hypothetical protein
MRGTRLFGVLVAGAIPLGVVLGVLWHWWWKPPIGIVVSDEWVLSPAGPDFAFDGTALYVLIGAVAGLVAGAVVGQFVGDRGFAALGGVLVGALVAAWVMFAVGHALGPPDPQLLAAGKEDLATLPAQLGVGDDVAYAPFGSTAVLALPVGARRGRQPEDG